MKSIRLKLLIAVLVMFSFTFFMSIGSTKAIYREVKSTTINLTVISSNDCLIQFNSNGGSSVANRYVSPNTAIGTLPIPTKSGYNFAGWYDSNNQRVRHSTVITSDTDLHAVWTEIVCKLVTDENNLHNETCQGGGCAVSGTGFNTSNNNTITYGTIGNGVPISGDAYNCDVDYNGIYDEKESDNLTFIERFYFVRTKTNTNTEDSAVMYYSTSFDSTGRNNRTQSKTDIESKNYTTALTYLPQATLWDNPGLINLGNGKVTRFVSDDDMEEVCGTLTFSNTSYFTSCQKWFWFENTRFQSLNMGRAGIWMEYNGGAKYHRIHSQSLNLGEVESSSENMARPVIEIPMSALEGYYDEDRFTISYNTYLGDTNPISSVLKYRGEALGPLPIPVREDYTFDNWYTDSNYQNVANPTSLVSGNTTLYANWNPILAIEVTLHLNDGTITGVTSPISMNSGELLDNLPDPEREGYTFVGWFTDSACTIPFDPTEPITASMDLYADWELIQTVTITLHLNDGTITGVTSPITINSGELLDNLPDPEREGYTFEGWFTDSACTIPFDSTQPITTDLDLYADWEEDNYVASVNGTKYTTLSAAINAVPTGKVKTTVKILKNITLTSPQSIPNTKWVELDLQNFTIDGSSGDLFRNSGYLDIINGTIVSTANIGGNNPGYVVKNVSGAILTISGGTLRYDNSASAEAKVIKNTGTVNITGGRIESNASAAAIDNMESSGTLNVTGGEIISTNTYKGQAIYIASGSTVNISGTAYIENASASSGDNARAAVDNNNGTLTITGGTIVSKNYAAVGSRNASGVTYIGINDNGGNIIDTTIPILIGGKNAIIRSNGSINVYDGVFKSGEQAAHDGNVVLLSGTEFYFDDTETISGVTYNVYYLKQSTGGPYTVTFDPLNDGINTTVVNNIQAEGTVGSSMPANPTRQNYIFVKWYINVNEDGTFTSTTPIVNNITVTAKWKPAIGSATINPLSISMLEGETETIVVTGPVGMEDYSFSSSDTSVAIVNQDGEVTAVADGTATIYITGSESNTSQTVPVSVNPIVYHTVTFYKELNGEVVKTVQVEHGTQIGSANMPANNPTKTNYVFDNWYVNGATNTPAFNASATINDDVNVIANWFETVDYATMVINPDPMELNVGDTGTITLNPTVSGDTVESYTCSSSNSSVASVNNCTITAASAGNATITITGSDPQNPKTVNVTVSVPIVYHTVTFYKELNGEVIKTVQVEHGTQIGSANMPANNPTKTNYVFDNWYVNGATNTPAFNASATINDDVDVIANWFETVDYATMVINPAPMNLYVGDTGTITLNPTISGDTVESYTCSSSNGSVATVNNCTVTAVGIGSTTITITGSDPSHPKTVNVTVDILKHTVIFDKNNGDQNAIITINNVEHGSNLSDIIPADPTKTDYIFDNWYSVESSTWTNNPIDTEMLVNDDLEYKAGFYTTSDVAAIGHYYYTTLANAFAAINNNSVPTNNIEILKDFTVPTDSGQNRPTINSKKVANINGNNHTITCGNENIVYNNGGTVTISNITLTCNASKTAPLNNAGTMTIIDSTASMTLTGTNGRAAVYNTGTVNIEGNSILSTVAKERSTVQNVSSGAKINISGGTITQGASDATKPAVEVVSGSSATITGGTITSTHLYGIDNAGTLVIGTKDDQYSTTSIVITGEQYGINSTANYSLYDGLIKGKSNNKAVNDESKINITEDGAVQQTGTDGDYYTLYYIIQSASPTPTPTPAPTPTPTATPTPNQLTISFDAIGVTNPSSQQVNEGSPIESLPTVTWGNKTFDGWYTDMSYTTQVTTSTIPEDDATYYAKWTYTPANSKVTYDSTNDAMDEYFDNISTWKNQNESTFATTMLTNFNNNSCSNCNAANNCDNPTSGTYCDKPKEYNTNTNSALSVFLYDETNHVIGEKVEYASLTNGKITNLIPGVTYYWEKTSDPTVNGLIEATTPRRVLDAGNVRNVRDLGGLSVTYTENNVQKTGTIKYGKLFRGAKLTSSQADVTSLEKLGVTREIDLRPDSERGGAARFTVFDNYGNSGGDIIIHNYLINRTAITYSYLDKNNNSQTTVSSYSSYADELKSALKKTMQYVIDGDNIYFHCTIGTDRTGTLAYFLEGLLGVSEEDRVEDYELTYFFGLTNRTRYHDHLDGSDINPRFTFMHVTYPSNQDIYNWFVDGDSSSELTADNNLITAFRNAMIDN